MTAVIGQLQGSTVCSTASDEGTKYSVLRLRGQGFYIIMPYLIGHAFLTPS